MPGSEKTIADDGMKKLPEDVDGWKKLIADDGQ